MKTNKSSSSAVATPPAAAKKSPASSSAPVKTPAPAAGTTGTPTSINVHIDVGFGNAIFIRGSGGGLSWERGLPMVCVNGKIWHWTGVLKDEICFKPLINDRIWAVGNDSNLKPGEKLDLTPIFP